MIIIYAKNNFQSKKYFFLVVLLFFTLSVVRADAISSAQVNNLTSDEMSTLTLKDSMYYHFDEWFTL